MKKPTPTNTDDNILDYVERWERVAESIADARAILADLKREARAANMSTKHLALIVKLRATDPHDLQENDELVAAYRAACDI